MIFAKTNLKVCRDVVAGESINLMSIFNSHERFKIFSLQANIQEDQLVQIHLGNLGVLEAPVGNDMQSGQKKTLMTLFWYPERTKEVRSNAGIKAGEIISIEIKIKR